jgi:uncharacterized membrane protein
MLCIAALVWSAAVWLTPAALARDSRSFGSVAWIPYALGGLICHQRPERSFSTSAIPWPVCARCAGLYLSTAAGILVAFPVSAADWARAETWRRWRTALLFAAVPSVASWVLEAAGLWSSTNGARALLAVPLGVVIGALIASIARQSGPVAART